ncbi:MAG: MATE family efflux transporter [Agathobacter sp.]|nr:MATE family efflux transporter [Agathobacter sp.]
MKAALTEGSIGKQLIKFFLPIMFGTFFQQLYNTVDAIVVGRFVGSDALAAVGGSAGMIVNLIVGFFVGLTAGASVIVSQFFGSGDRQMVSKSMHTIYAFSIIGSFVISVVGYLFAPALLGMMNTPTDIFEDSLLYLRVFLVGIVFMFVYNTGSALLRAIGDSRRPLNYLIVCCVINIVLDILFVAVFHMGVFGAALATLIALAISSVLVTKALVNSKELCDFSIREIRIDWNTLKTQIYIGFPGGIQSSMYSLSNMILQVAVNGIGTDAAAAWTTLAKMDAIYWMVGGSLGTALTTIVGQNYGAGKMDRVKKSVSIGIRMYYAFAIVIVIVLMAFQRPLFSLFTDNQAVIEIAVSCFSIMALFYILFSFIEIYSCALRGMGDVVIPTIMTMVGICGFRVLWSIFVVPMNPSMELISWSYPYSWALTSLCFIIYYRYKIKKLEIKS